MIQLGGKSQVVLSKNCSKNPEQNFLNFIFLHLAIFSLIFSPYLSNLSFNLPSNFSPRQNAHGNQFTLTATNDINLKSSSNLSKFYNIGGSLYVDIPIIGGGFSLGGELHAARNKDTTFNNTKIEAGNNFTLNSGHDTNLVGAMIANIKADGTDGNNLTLNTKFLA